VLLISILLLGLSTDSFAQQAKVAVQQGPYYLGEPVLVRVTAEGFEEHPQPICEPGKLPPGVAIKEIGVRPSVTSVTQVINGRMTSYRKVVFAFDFHVVAEKPGEFRLPPFKVKQNQQAVSTQGLALRVQRIQTDKDIRVSLVLPSQPIYPGQRVPVRVEWWYAGNLDEVRDLTFRSPVFDQFTFVTEPLDRKDMFLPVDTEKGTLRLKAKMDRRKLDGREFTVVTATPLLVVNHPGEYEIEPITATMNKVTRWRRGVFGRREPASMVRLRAVDRPRKLVIRPLPLDQAPASFAGAIGRGFTLKVEADRTVVRVGDPITLIILLRGEGNLGSAALPPLSADGGLDPKRFRLPRGEVSGTLSGDSKSFTVTVRVLDESVAEIPPLAYSWFDPQMGQFQTARSNPIALRVQSTRMVRAQDVVSGAPKPQGKETAEKSRVPQAVKRASAGLPKRYDLTGADLAIEASAAKLLVNESERYGGIMVRTGIYLASVLLVFFAWLWRRVAEVDPEIHRRRKLVKEQLRQITQAGRLPRYEAARQIAAAMRRMTTQANGQLRGEVEHLLMECDNLAYAPDGDTREPLDQTLYEHAIKVAEGVAKEVS
jgi:hypothetical protein